MIRDVCVQSEDMAGFIASFPTVLPFHSRARAVPGSPLPTANARKLAQQAASDPEMLVRYPFEL